MNATGYGETTPGTDELTRTRFTGLDLKVSMNLAFQSQQCWYGEQRTLVFLLHRETTQTVQLTATPTTSMVFGTESVNTTIIHVKRLIVVCS